MEHPRVVIILDNSQFIKTKLAEDFYVELGDFIEKFGFKVFYDAGWSKTDTFANVWIGHCSGADRLKNAPRAVMTVKLGEARKPRINDFTLTDDIKFNLASQLYTFKYPVTHDHILPKLESYIKNTGRILGLQAFAQVSEDPQDKYYKQIQNIFSIIQYMNNLIQKIDISSDIKNICKTIQTETGNLLNRMNTQNVSKNDSLGILNNVKSKVLSLRPVFPTRLNFSPFEKLFKSVEKFDAIDMTARNQKDVKTNPVLPSSNQIPISTPSFVSGLTTPSA